MSNGVSPALTIDLAARLALLHQVGEGKLDELHCPNCGTGALSVWFTRRSDNDYWTWFVCKNCRFEMRAQGSRPAHYSEKRERTSEETPREPGLVPS
jgi:hypothetical protein